MNLLLIISFILSCNNEPARFIKKRKFNKHLSYLREANTHQDISDKSVIKDEKEEIKEQTEGPVARIEAESETKDSDNLGEPVATNRGIQEANDRDRKKETKEQNRGKLSGAKAEVKSETKDSNNLGSTNRDIQEGEKQTSAKKRGDKVSYKIEKLYLNREEEEKAVNEFKKVEKSFNRKRITIFSGEKYDLWDAYNQRYFKDKWSSFSHMNDNQAYGHLFEDRLLFLTYGELAIISKNSKDGISYLKEQWESKLSESGLKKDIKSVIENKIAFLEYLSKKG